MIYDAMIDTYARKADRLEQRLAELRADHEQRHDDRYSARVSLLEREARELRRNAALLSERQTRNV